MSLWLSLVTRALHAPREAHHAERLLGAQLLEFVAHREHLDRLADLADALANGHPMAALVHPLTNENFSQQASKDA